jgi:hypothetical protein
MQQATMQILLADWWLLRANIDREIAFQEGNPHCPDDRALNELKELADELDRLIDGCAVGEAAPTSH